MKISDFLSPLLRPFGLSNPKRLFPGLSGRPKGLSRIKAYLQNIKMRPGTLARPKGSSTKQKREYITGGFSVENDVLNLDFYNLIGVFGPPEDREALLLNPNGRITRLKVGSRFARGRVISIGKDEMIYIRDNKNYVLRMNN